MVDAAVAEMLATFCSTAECASAENSRPPYFFGMIMPKNLFFLMKSQTSGGRSASSWVICQSSSMAHSSSTGPSRKACSSADSSGFGWPCNCDQSGLPENSSPSKPTVPASSAVCSVSDSFGVTFANIFSSGALICLRRRPSRFRGTATSPNRTSTMTVASGACAMRPRMRVAAAVTTVHMRRPTRK